MANSTVTVQDGNASAVASGNGQNVTPGNTVTIALVDSTNVTAWFLRVSWTNGSTNEFNFNANSLTVNQSPNWNATFTAPAEGTGFEFYSEVIATSGAPAPTRFGIYCRGAGDAGVTFPADPQQRINALQSPRFQPPTELQAAPGAADPKVLAVATSLAAYTGTGTGTLTGSANGAIGTQDGVTLTVGSILHLPVGLANLTAADEGPYMVQALGTASAKYVLVRPGWFAQGTTAQQGMTFEVMQGSAYGGTTWKATASGSVIGTTAASFQMREFAQAGTALGADFKVNAVATSIAAYTGTGTGVLTGSVNGALGAQDGQTLTAGQLIHLPAGTTNVTAADEGPYIVVVVGTAGSKYVLQRPGWFQNGATAPQGLGLYVLAGTKFAGTTWKVTTASTAVIGTTAAGFYPRQVTVNQPLTAGAATITGIPVLSATTTQAVVSKLASGGTVTSTVGYCPSNNGATGLTAGVVGTGQVVVNAIVAAGTTNAADTSTLQVTIINQV